MWCCHTCVLVKYLIFLGAKRSCPFNLRPKVVVPAVPGIISCVELSLPTAAVDEAQINSLTGWLNVSAPPEATPAFLCNCSIRYSWDTWAKRLRSSVSR